MMKSIPKLMLIIIFFGQIAAASAGDLTHHWDTSRVLNNPHKGWYHHFYANGTGAYGYIGQDLSIIPNLEFLYIRLAWSFFEPQEDQYDWSMIDAVIDQYGPQGYKIALCVTSKETGDDPWGVHQEIDGVHYATPKWVRDAGAKGTEVNNWGLIHWEPDFSDPVFLAKLEDFHAALSARYDGQPYMEYVDLCSIGDWGEGHTGFSSGIVPSAATVKSHVDIYQRQYRQTPISANDDYVYWQKSAAESDEIRKYMETRNIWFSDFSVMVEWWMKAGAPDTYGIAHPELFADNYLKTPVVIESHHYKDLQGWGVWNTPDGKGCAPYGAPWLLEDIELMHASYISFQGWPDVYMADNPEFARQVANKVGYWYFIKQSGWDVGKSAGDAWYFWMEWVNQGVAPAYHTYQLKLKLNGPVTKYFTIPDSFNKGWADGESQWETYHVDLPLDMVAGNYRIKVKLYDPATAREVDLGLSTSLKDADGYFDVGDVDFKDRTANRQNPVQAR